MKKDENCHCKECVHSHILKVKELHIHYGKVCALHDINFEVACGQALALIGGNGAGKTTLMKAIVGIVPKHHGSVLWRDKSIVKSTYEIAYLPQKEKIDWSFPLTVKSLVEMGRYPLLGPLKKLKDIDKDAIENALKLLEIYDLKDRQIGALSGGQQQRVFIARALAQESHVLLLDEPFTGLDEPSKVSLIQTLKKLTTKGKLIIASHHDLKNVSDIFDKVLVINRKFIGFGDSKDILNEDIINKAF